MNLFLLESIYIDQHLSQDLNLRVKFCSMMQNDVKKKMPCRFLAGYGTTRGTQIPSPANGCIVPTSQNAHAVN